MSPKQQREALIEDGVPEENIVSGEAELPNAREGDVVTVPYLEPLGEDPKGKKAPYPHFLAKRFGALTDGGRALRVAETNKTYEGVDGLVSLIWDWVTTMRRNQTRRGRGESGGRPKQPAPSFYLDLSQGDKIKLRQQYETRTIDGEKAGVEKIARRWKTSKPTLERLANSKGWAKPGSE